MKIQSYEMNKSRLILICFLFAVISRTPIKAQQKISLGLHADPAISWFSSDVNQVTNNGAAAGFNFGLTFNKYFTPNYAFSTGISLLNVGGRLKSSDTTKMEFKNFISTVLPGTPVTYKIQYLTIPIGLKLQTNQIGYVTFFSDIGFDPKVVIGGKADIPVLKISNENAMKELNIFNLSYHVTAGVEYSLGGSTSLLAGLNFDNNFLDITKDNGKQPKDKISHKILSFRLGINF
jgi:hypothetical protein